MASAPIGRRSALAPAAVAVASAFGLLAACSGDDDSGHTGTGGSSGAGKGGSGGKGGSSAGKGGSAGHGTAGNGTGGARSAGGAPNGGQGGEFAGAGGEAQAGGGAGGAGAVDNDVEPLNALLTAEYNAVMAYTAGAGLIDAADSSDALFDLKDVVKQVALNVQAQHQLHAAALASAVSGLGGTPVAEAAVAKTFKAPKALTDNPTISNVLKFAAGAERGAAVAYNQMLATMESASLRFLASSIEGDETQHFIVLAALVLGLADPGPNLDTGSADTVFPKAFVAKVGSQGGLDTGPDDYFA